MPICCQIRLREHEIYGSQSFIFVRKDDAHDDHMHHATFIFSLAGEKPIFNYDIVDIANGSPAVGTRGAHGKGGGTGG